jgi:hypothetical protein
LEFGPNAVVEEKVHPVEPFLRHFWAPSMLEATTGLQILLGEWLSASMIAALLLDHSRDHRVSCRRSGGRDGSLVAAGADDRSIDTSQLDEIPVSGLQARLQSP